MTDTYEDKTYNKYNDPNYSEFGRGLAYNLGLFLAHTAKYEYYKEIHKTPYPEQMSYMDEEMFFNGASDHVYDLLVENAPIHLQPRLQEFKDKCLHWGHGYTEPHPTKSDVYWSIQEAKNLLLELDKANNIPALKGEWE